MPVNRWTRRQVTLCGTCLSSVKESETGKMHVLPLIGGKVEEVKKHQHCLAISSSEPQSKTYYICYFTFAEYFRWHRQASKRVDLSCNELTKVKLPETLPATLQELDLTGNSNLVLDHKTLEVLNNISCFKIDQPSAGDVYGAPAVCSHGYTEASGIKNNCARLPPWHANSFPWQVPYAAISDSEDEEPIQARRTEVTVDMHHDPAKQIHMVLQTPTEFTNESFFITANKQDEAPTTRTIGHPRRNGCVVPEDSTQKQIEVADDAPPRRRGGYFSAPAQPDPDDEFIVPPELEDEDGKVNGVTDSTRILGYTFLHPSVVPRPHVQSITLPSQDEFFILGSKGLWDSLSIDEAVEAVRNVHDALAAAKKLCMLAQSYGCNDSLSVVVVQLDVTEDSFCCYEFNRALPSSPSSFPQSVKDKPSDVLGMPLLSSGTASEISSEIFISEMSSEVGSTASNEPPQVTMNENSPAYPSVQRRAHLPQWHANSFPWQLPNATMSDTDDEDPIQGRRI